MGFILAVFLISIIYSEKLSGLTIVFGVAGAGIAFALQEVIASLAGWVAMSFGRFYKVGDRVQLGGIKGDVIDIGMLRTTLMECGGWINGDLYNGRIVRVEYTLRYIVDYKKRRTTKDLICERLLTRIDETQGRIKTVNYLIC